jgi:hypothetical protein
VSRLHKLSEAVRKRSGFQDLAAKGLITIDELRGKLAELEETRQTAEKELEKLKQYRQHLEELERDKDAVLEAYAQMAPQALDALTAEERHQLYKMLRVRVTACADGPLEITGMLGKDAGVRKTEPTPGVVHDASAVYEDVHWPELLFSARDQRSNPSTVGDVGGEDQAPRAAFQPGLHFVEGVVPARGERDAGALAG